MCNLKCAASDQIITSYFSLLSSGMKTLLLISLGLLPEILLFRREGGFVMDRQVSASALQWHHREHSCSAEASQVRKWTRSSVEFILYFLLVIFVLTGGKVLADICDSLFLSSWLKEWKLRTDREEGKNQKDKKQEEGSNGEKCLFVFFLCWFIFTDLVLCVQTQTGTVETTTVRTRRTRCVTQSSSQDPLESEKLLPSMLVLKSSASRFRFIPL